jgi:hypothetical protein
MICITLTCNVRRPIYLLEPIFDAKHVYDIQALENEPYLPPVGNPLGMHNRPQSRNQLAGNSDVGRRRAYYG